MRGGLRCAGVDTVIRAEICAFVHWRMSLFSRARAREILPAMLEGSDTQTLDTPPADCVHIGDHFYSDVLAGAVLGGVVGWLVPAWHRVAPASVVSFEPLPGGATVAWRMDF